MQAAKADYSSVAPLLTAKMMEKETAVRCTPAGDAEDSFHSVTSTMSGYTRKKLSETRNVSLTRITIPQNGYSQKPTREPTLTSQANSPLYAFMSPTGPGSAKPASVRVYLPHLFGEEQDNDQGSTCVQLVVSRGATACDILLKVAEELKVDHTTAKETFALWMCSSLLELQLKDHHIPCDLFRGWKDLLTKFAADSSHQEQANDQPLLYLKRNVHLSLEREMELMESEKLVNMLWWEAKTTLFSEKYYLNVLDAATLAGIGFAIDYCGKEQPPQTIEFVRRNLESQLPDNLSDAIRGPMMFGKTLSSGSNLEKVLEMWKRASSGETQVHKLKRDYLANLRENCQQYGCAFFRGYIERPSVSPLKNLKRFFQAVATGDADMSVTVAINREFITVADSDKHEIILRVRIRDCSWRKIECSSENEDEAEMPMMLLHFPEVDPNDGHESSKKTNLLQIFGYQAVLVDSMLKTMVGFMKSAEQLSDSAPSSSSSSEDGTRFVNRTPSLTKCDRMCLATFVNGQCVKASGSLKKLKETEWRKMQVV